MGINKPDTDRFQDCCKNWTLNPGFYYYGYKKLYILKVLKISNLCKRKMKEKRKKLEKVVWQLQAREF